MSTANLEYRVHHHGEAFIITLVGEVDIAGVPALKTWVDDHIQGGAVDLVLDLSHVEAIDSTGLGFLVWSRKRLREESGRLRLVSNRPQVQRVLKLTGLGRLFETFLSLEEALQAPARGNEGPEEGSL